MTLIWIFALIILPVRARTIDVPRTAVCFLTVRPAQETLIFADELERGTQHDGIDVFVMIDDNEFDVSFVLTSMVTVVQIPNQRCVKQGYMNAMHVDSRPMHISAWDKGLLYFAKLNRNYSFVWFIEEDVFIPSVDAFLAVHKLYSPTNDLIVKRVDPNLSGDIEAWAHWHLAYGKLSPPWFKSMVNAVGVSRRLLQAIGDYVRWRGIATFHEFLLQTLAINSNMSVVFPTELDTLEWAHHFTWDNIKWRPNNWWHPVKNLSDHAIWRQRLVEQNNNTKDDIRWTRWRTLCNEHYNATMIKDQLEKLVFAFDQVKIHLSPKKRRWMRKRFLCLAQQCKARQDLSSAEMILQRLADNAYKLFQFSWPAVANKSTIHLILERELAQNKGYVLHFFKYPAVVKWFRKLATNLTILLTDEIQRETKGVNLQPVTNKFDVLDVVLDYCLAVSTAKSVAVETTTVGRMKGFAYQNLQSIYFLSLGTMLCTFVLVRLFRLRNKNSVEA